MGALLLAQVLLVVFGIGRITKAEPAYACDISSNASLASLPFCDFELHIEARVQDLVSRLTIPEKVSQMVNQAQGISRLGIPSYQWWQEALHGVASSPGVQFGGIASGATSFPMPINTAASFNTTLFFKIGEATATEARALHNLGRSGLTFWSPNVNIFRDPRWGRGQETPGEDPLLSSNFAASYVRGLQGEEMDHMKVSACCKHITAYDVDNWKGTDRYHFNAEVTEQDLFDTFNPPFHSCIKEGKVSCVMCSYNRVNGVPTCADERLLTETVRNSWGLDGYIVSDCDALQIIYNDASYSPSPEDVVADSVSAGLDLNCGTFLLKHAQAALQAGKLSESDLNRAVSNLMRTRMRLGLFNGAPANQPYGSLGGSDICTDEHQQVALDAALQGIVLLKNDGSLPLSPAMSTLAIIGPNANATQTMLGNYEGIPCKYISPLQGLQVYNKDINILYAPGCQDVTCSQDDHFVPAINASKRADAVVLVFGLDQSQETETRDRTSLLLPGLQSELINKVASAVNCSIVLVIMSGGPVDLSSFKEDPRISGIIWLGYPGQSGGAALAQVLFGSYNPGGRLPVTWYPEEFAKVTMLDMRMRPNPATDYPGRSYRFYTGSTVFPFGHGLSYTTYSYRFVSAPAILDFYEDSLSSEEGCPAAGRSCNGGLRVPDNCDSLEFNVTIVVSNNGHRSGSHPVLLFWLPPPAPGRPQKQLVAFKRVQLEAGTMRNVEFVVDPCKHLSNVRRNGERFLEQGQHMLRVGEEVHHFVVRWS